MAHKPDPAQSRRVFLCLCDRRHKHSVSQNDRKQQIVRNRNKTVVIPSNDRVLESVEDRIDRDGQNS